MDRQQELENTPNYILYTQALGDIDATLDNVKDAINNTDNGGYFSEINETLSNLVAQTFQLNIQHLSYSHGFQLLEKLINHY